MILILVSGVSTAQTAARPESPRNVAWTRPTRITITTRSPEIPTVETLAFRLAENGDTLISGVYPQESSRPERQVLVVNSRWMATKDAVLQSGYEIDALDGPMLTMQLVLRFLELAHPAGPISVRGRQSLELAEEFKPIRVNTVSAEGGWEAPWTLHGFLERKSATLIAYDFVVLHSEPGDPNIHSIQFSGTWDSEPAQDLFPDTMSLRNWRIYKIGPVTTKGENGDGVRFAAHEESTAYATLGDLRTRPAPQNTASEKPARKISVPSSLSLPMQRY